MIICNPIPGHEDRNVTFLCDSGATIAVSRKLPLQKAVKAVFSDSALTASMQSAVSDLRKPTALYDLCDEIVRLAKEAEADGQ